MIPKSLTIVGMTRLFRRQFPLGPESVKHLAECRQRKGCKQCYSMQGVCRQAITIRWLRQAARAAVAKQQAPKELTVREKVKLRMAESAAERGSSTLD